MPTDIMINTNGINSKNASPFVKPEYDATPAQTRMLAYRVSPSVRRNAVEKKERSV